MDIGRRSAERPTPTPGVACRRAVERDNQAGGNASVVRGPQTSRRFAGLRGSEQRYVLGHDWAQRQDQVDPLVKLRFRVIQ